MFLLLYSFSFPLALHPIFGAFLLELRSEEHTSELQSRPHLVCRLLLEKKKTNTPFPRSHAHRMASRDWRVIRALAGRSRPWAGTTRLASFRFVLSHTERLWRYIATAHS